MSVKLNAAQVKYLNQIHNQYPGLLETSLAAIKQYAPHLLAPPVPPGRKYNPYAGMGGLGGSTMFGGSTSLFSGTNTTTTSPATSTSSGSTASDTSSFWSGLTGILTAALPTYIAVHSGQNNTQVQGNTSIGQTTGLLSSFGIGTGISSMVLLGGAAVLAFVLLRKKKKS